MKKMLALKQNPKSNDPIEHLLKPPSLPRSVSAPAREPQKTKFKRRAFLNEHNEYNDDFRNTNPESDAKDFLVKREDFLEEILMAETDGEDCASSVLNLCFMEHEGKILVESAMPTHSEECSERKCVNSMQCLNLMAKMQGIIKHQQNRQQTLLNKSNQPSEQPLKSLSILDLSHDHQNDSSELITQADSLAQFENSNLTAEILDHHKDETANSDKFSQFSSEMFSKTAVKNSDDQSVEGCENNVERKQRKSSSKSKSSWYSKIRHKFWMRST